LRSVPCGIRNVCRTGRDPQGARETKPRTLREEVF
jgi:hypothetical protein